MSPALKANLVAFAAGALGAVGLFFLMFLAKMYRESSHEAADQRATNVFISLFAAISLAITLTPLWIGAGVFGIIVMHLARWLRGLF